MAFTRVVGPGIHTQANIDSHNIHSTGIITATKFDGPFDSINVSGAATFTGNVTIGGTLTYEDVTNIDSVGLITARKGIISSGVVTATAFHGASQVGIQSGGFQIGAGITQLNFVGTGNTFAVNGTTVDISIQGGGGGAGSSGGSGSSGGGSSVFNTAEFQSNFGLARIGALTSLNNNATGSGIIVGILDTGIDLDNPEFSGPNKIAVFLKLIIFFFKSEKLL